MKTVDINELNELDRIAQKHSQKKRGVFEPKECRWSIGAEYPYIVRLRGKTFNSDSEKSFETVDEAFAYRRSISTEYYKPWKAREDFEAFRNSAAAVFAK